MGLQTYAMIGFVIISLVAVADFINAFLFGSDVMLINLIVQIGYWFLGMFTVMSAMLNSFLNIDFIPSQGIVYKGWDGFIDGFGKLFEGLLVGIGYFLGSAIDLVLNLLSLPFHIIGVLIEKAGASPQFTLAVPDSLDIPFLPAIIIDISSLTVYFQFNMAFDVGKDLATAVSGATANTIDLSGTQYLIQQRFVFGFSIFNGEITDPYQVTSAGASVLHVIPPFSVIFDINFSLNDKTVFGFSSPLLLSAYTLVKDLLDQLMKGIGSPFEWYDKMLQASSS